MNINLEHTSIPQAVENAGHSTASAQEEPLTFWHKLISILRWKPQRCHFDPAHPPPFTFALTLLYAFTATFSIANQYYNHPILNKIAEHYDVSYERVSAVPTLTSTGYAAGLLLLCPLGDTFKKRGYILLLNLISALLWIPLCITDSFALFCVFSFLSAVTAVAAQLVMPLVDSLAPRHRRATYLSIVVSGIMFGVLIGRILSGLVTQYSGSWRTIYWVALGLQMMILILLWLFMPDYPSANPGGINYFKLLGDIGKLLVREPLLMQACLVGLLTYAMFASFWTTLTFLLASPPYLYSSMTIGLLAFIGIAGMAFAPLFTHFVIEKLPLLFSIILGELTCLVGIIIGTYTGKFTIAGPVVQAFAIDLGLQISQIAQRTAIYAIDPKQKNRINTAYMVSLAVGLLMGAAVGNKGYAQGGWIESGSISVGFAGLALVICVARGPWEQRWVGWRGGWRLKKHENVTDRSEGIDRGLEGESRPHDTDEEKGRHTAGTVSRDSPMRGEVEEEEEKVLVEKKTDS